MKPSIQDLTEKELIELKALCEKVTLAPWEVFSPFINGFDIVSLSGDVELGTWIVVEKMRREVDAQAIVALRNAAPALISMALRALELSPICLNCGRPEPCHLDKAETSGDPENWPGSPCTFDVTPKKISIRIRKLEEALGALGAIGNGYCFCSENRDPLKQEHEPECRDARAVLSEEA